MKGNLAQKTAERLYEQIAVEGRPAPGDKLPNEVELASALGVSRATLRESIRILVSRGVLEVRRGRGTFVSAGAKESGDFGFGALGGVKGQLRELFELRMIVEPQVAALACERAGGEELEEILKRGKAVEECIRMGADRTQADREFHAAIVRAAHNEFMMRLLPIINQAVETAVTSVSHGEKLAEDTLRDHALLMEFFQKRDPEGTRHAMAIHMRHAMDEMGLVEAER